MKGRKIQEQLANKLHEETDVIKDVCGLPEVDVFAKHIKYNIAIVGLPDTIIYKTELKDEDGLPLRYIYIMKTENHYDTITSMTAFLSKEKFCELCFRGYKSTHRCEFKCNICETKDCKGFGNKTRWQDCKDCNRKFPNDQCFENHRKRTPLSNSAKELGPSQCLDKAKCLECGLTYKKKKGHTCGIAKCQNCKQEKALNHECYIQAKALKEPSTKYVFFDFEATQDSVEHVVDHCESQYYEGGEPVIHKDIDEFCEWAFDTKHQGYTFIAHNARGYDCQFVLRWLVNKKRTPFVIYQGGKIMMMSYFNGKNKIRFIDSLSFLTMPLSAFPKTFGLTELKKGYFPHYFNKQTNQDYKGPMPHKKHYGYNSMNSKTRKDFLEWYDKQVNEHNYFDMAKELEEYCHSDVDILRKGCMDFRKQFLEFGVDPFQYTTIASCVMALYKAKFMPADGIAVIPNEKLNKTGSSKSCIEWLSYIKNKIGYELQHGQNGKEKIINYKGQVFKLDGWDEKTKTAYEFYGCYWHGCKECNYSNKLNTSTNKTFGALYAKTMDRERLLMMSGAVDKIVSIWGCEWNRMRKKEEIQETALERVLEEESIDPRHAMFGGRTNALSLFWTAKDEFSYAKYIDICSLYPTVQYYDPYPNGHHTTIKGQEAHDMLKDGQAFGIVKIRMLPPRGLLHPVLPCQDRGKMMYYLCNTCGKNNMKDKCEHDETKRALTGTWATPLIYKAMEKGYKIVKVFELWHWEQQTTGLFKEYIKTFLKVKQESSGYPEECDTEEKKKHYIQDFHDKIGVMMDENRIAKNPGRRAVAKLCLNSLWGKFGQKQNMTQNKIVNTEEEMYKILNDKKTGEVSLNIIDDDCIEISYDIKQDALCDPFNTNIATALFTTAHAQMRLYHMMDKLGDRILYHDTDSVIYSTDTKKGERDMETGDQLGEWTDELDGAKIKTFVGGGPKCYGYVLDNGKSSMKLKGFSMNYETTRALNLVNMFSVISSGLNIQDSEIAKKATEELGDLLESIEERKIAERVARYGKVAVITESKITRNKAQKKITSEYLEKVFRFTYTKRVIQEPEEHRITTLPYGY